MTKDATEVVEHVARAMHEGQREQYLRLVPGGERHPSLARPWEELTGHDRFKRCEQYLPIVQLVLDALEVDEVPDPVTQAVAAAMDGDRELQASRALIAVLRVVGTVVVGELELNDATSGEWGVWAQPDRANGSIEFSARQA